MSRQVPLFQLRLRDGASIGPAELKRIWSAASECDEVGVAREVRSGSDQYSSPLYSLNAPRTLQDLAAVELRLRQMLQDALSADHVELRRLA